MALAWREQLCFNRAEKGTRWAFSAHLTGSIISMNSYASHTEESVATMLIKSTTYRSLLNKPNTLKNWNRPTFRNGNNFQKCYPHLYPGYKNSNWAGMGSGSALAKRLRHRASFPAPQAKCWHSETLFYDTDLALFLQLTEFTCRSSQLSVFEGERTKG